MYICLSIFMVGIWVVCGCSVLYISYEIFPEFGELLSLLFAGSLVWFLGNGVILGWNWIKDKRASKTLNRGLRTLPKDVVAYCICPFLDLRIEISFRSIYSRVDSFDFTNGNVIKALYGRTDYRSDNLDHFEYYVYFRRVRFHCNYHPSLDIEKLLHGFPNKELTSLWLCVGSFRAMPRTHYSNWYHPIRRFIRSLSNLHELILPTSGYATERLNIYFPLFKDTSILPKLRVVDLGRWYPFRDGTESIPEQPHLANYALIFSLIKVRMATVSEIRFSIIGSQYDTGHGCLARMAINYCLKFDHGYLVKFTRIHQDRFPTTHAVRKEQVQWAKTFDYRKLFDEIGYPDTMRFEKWRPLPHEFMYCGRYDIDIEWVNTKCTKNDK